MTRSVEDLRARLEQAEATLAAISRGEVDGLIVTVDGAARVFTLEGSDAFYRALVEQMPEGAAAVTADGTILYANGSLASLLGVPVEQLPATELIGHVLPRQRPLVVRLLQEPGRGPSQELELQRQDGSHVPVAVSVRPVDGQAQGVRCVVVVDLTARRRAEHALREAESRFRGAFDGAPIGMALLSLDGCVEQVNAALCQLAGRTSEELVGQPLPWLDAATVRSALAGIAAGGPDRATFEGRLGASAEPPFVTVRLRLLQADGVPRHVIAQVQDESERRRHEEQLLHVADHDHLTGLLNRRGFDAALGARLEQVRRFDRDGVLLLLDIDHFKYINDTRGHHVGDEVLVQLARALRSELRDSDVLARLGGDEFAVLLPGGDPAAVADHLLGAARGVVVDALDGRRLTISIGATTLTAARGSAGEVMALADTAMFDSKEAGRDRATVVQSRSGSTSAHGARLTWLSRVEHALARGELLLDAQPIVDLETGRSPQVELLVRLPSGHGPVPAHEWFPTAERCGLAPQIDEWVVDQAFSLLAENRFDALNVNVSATSLGREGWQRLVVAGLARTGIDASRITFEVTETAAIGNISAAVRFTEDLRRLGCRLALDDFGAGFASFYYLKHLPFDDVKIDGEFVRNCLHDERDRSIVRAMVDVAHSTGRRTVAECIEDVETLSLVRAQGVDLAQGWYLGRPEPVDLGPRPAP